MEIVLAIVLLFGGFTLGTMSAGNGEATSLTHSTQPDTAVVSESHPAAQTASRIDPSPCHPHGRTIYRDLSVPDQAQPQDCVGGCQDE